MVWDIRARTLVHELSTGNNSVESFAWGSAHTTLYASTTRSRIRKMEGIFAFLYSSFLQDEDVVGEEDWEDEDENSDDAPETDAHIVPTGENYRRNQVPECYPVAQESIPSRRLLWLRL